MPTSSTGRRRTLAPVTALLLIASLVSHEDVLVHVVVSAAFVVAVAAHGWTNRRWARGVLRRARGRLPRRLAVDAGWAAALVVLTLGVAVTGIVAALRGGDAAGTGHGELAALLTVAGIGHTVRHGRRRRRPGKGRRRPPAAPPSGRPGATIEGWRTPTATR